MSWFNKIKLLTEKVDNSPELKRGEMKEILMSNIKKTFPDFAFLSYHNNCYIFQRIRTLDNHKVYETFHIIFGLKDRNFACSVASRLNPEYIESSSYNTGLINPHVDLIALKKGTGIINIEEAYYIHNGKVKTTTKIVQQIMEDYKQFGIPFLDNQFNKLRTATL